MKSNRKSSNETKSTFMAIVVAVVILGSAFYFVNNDTSGGQATSPTIKNNNVVINNNVPTDNAPTNNVKIVDGKQIIELSVRGGYNPRVSNAKAGITTVIRFKTNNTFDCSVAIRIPSLGVTKMLPSTGDTDIPINSPQAGVLNGTCGMGMYRFAINFQ